MAGCDLGSRSSPVAAGHPPQPTTVPGPPATSFGRRLGCPPGRVPVEQSDSRPAQPGARGEGPSFEPLSQKSVLAACIIRLLNRPEAPSARDGLSGARRRLSG